MRIYCSSVSKLVTIPALIPNGETHAHVCLQLKFPCPSETPMTPYRTVFMERKKCFETITASAECTSKQMVNSSHTVSTFQPLPRPSVKAKPSDLVPWATFRLFTFFLTAGKHFMCSRSRIFLLTKSRLTSWATVDENSLGSAQCHFQFRTALAQSVYRLGYGLDDRGSRVRLPVRARNFSLHHSVKNGSGAHPASYPVRTRGSFLVGKVAGA
jgi:hypothetical protein